MSARDGSMSHDIYYRAGYATAAERLADADRSTLEAASRAVSDEHARLPYDSREAKGLMGALAALDDLHERKTA